MKKRIVYSFVALSGIPVLAEAAIVTGALPANGWGTGAAVQGDQVSSDNGGMLQQKLSLVPGKYKLIVDDIIVPDGGSVTIKVGTVSKEIKANGKAEVVFSLSAASVVDVSVEGTGIFTLKGVSVDLDFDFNGAIATLQQQLNGLSEAIKSYNSTDEQKANEAAAGLIQDTINLIKAGQSYENYTKYALYDLESSSITADIKKLAEKAAADETEYIGSTGAGDLTAQLTAVTMQIDKDDLNKASFDATAKTIESAIAAYKTAPTDEAKAAVEKQIAALQENVNKSNASLPTYKANVQAIADAKAAYNEAQKAVSDLFLDQVYKNGDINYGNIYENLFANAKAKLADTSKKIADAEAQVKAAQTGYKATSLVSEINAASTEASGVATEYTQKKDQINAKYDIVAGLQKALNGIKAASGAEDLSFVKRTSAQTEIDKVKAFYDGKNNAKEEILSATTSLDAANGAISTYEKYIGYANKYLDTKAAIAKAQDALAKALNGFDYQNYTPSTQYKSYVDGIAKALTDAQADIDKKLKANQDAKEKAANNQSDFASAGTVVSNKNNDITNLTNGTKAASKNYKQVFDDAAALQKKLNEALVKIVKESPDVASQYKGADIQKNITGWETTYAQYNADLANAQKPSYTAVNHYTDVATLALGDTKANIEAAINKLVADAAAAQTAFGYMAPFNLRSQLEAQIDAKLVEINKLDAAVNALDDNADFAKSYNYAEGTKLHAAYEAIAAKVAEVNSAAAAAKNSTPLSGQTSDDAKKAAVEVNKEVNAKLATYIEEIEKLTTDLNNSKDAIGAAIKAVQANEKAKAAYDTRKAAIDAAIAAAKTEAAKSTSADAVKVAADEFKKIDDAVKKIDEAVNKAYNKPNQNLAESVWTDGLNAVDAKDTGSIASALKAVKAAQENYDAYTALNGTAAAAKTTIASYKGQVGPTKYYDGLVDGYLKEVATAEGNIKNSYDAKTAVENKKAFEDAIAAIVAKAKKIATDAPANEKAYKGDGKDKGQYYNVGTDLQNYYNDVRFEILSSDQSSLLETWTKELDEIQSKINKLAADVDSYYNNGQSAAMAQEVANAIVDYKKELDNLLKRQQDGYDQQIADDNAARYKNFTDALASAQAAFQSAVDTQNEYSNVTNPELKEKIENNTETLIKSLYEYPVKLADLAQKTAEEYGKVTSPALYDETAEMATANQYAGEIKGIQEQLTNAALTGVSFDSYQEQVANAVAALNAKADIKSFYTVKENGKDVVKTAAQLKDVQNIIDAGKKALNEKKIAGVDDALNALADIDDMIAADQHNAAAAQLSDRVQKLSDAIEAHLEFLAGLEGQEGLIKNYQKAVDEKFAKAESELAKAQAEGKCFSDYDQLDALIDAFENDYDVSQAKDMFDTANNLPAVQKLLDEAIAEVSQYHVAPDYAEAWDNYQSKLDAAKADPSKTIASLSWQIGNERSNAYYTEFEYLKNEAPVELQDQYNQLVADKFAGMENETTAALKKKIEEVRKAASELASWGDKKATPADLVAFNARIAALFTEIQALYDTEIAGVTADALKEASAALAEKLTQLDGYVDVVKANAGLDAAKADIQGDIDAVNADITKYADNIVYYSDKIQGSIDYIDSKIDDVIADADKVQKKYDDNKVVYEARLAEIEALQAQLDEVAADFEACEIVSDPELKDWLTFDDEMADYQEQLDEIAEKVEADNAKLSVKENYNQAALAVNIERTHDEFSYEELYNLYLELNSTVNGLSWNNANYSKTVRETLTKERNGLLSAVRNFNIDIAADKNVLNEETYLSENLSAERFDERMETVTAIRARIDALKKIIENVTLGDLNGDGKVSVNDYTSLIDYIINEDLTPAEGTPEFDVADVNADGKLNIADATALINIILTGDRAGDGLVNEAPARVAGSSESVNIEASDMGNGMTRLAISLDNASNYVSCQMDVKLPAGMKLVGESLANRADGHELASGDFSGGIHRIVVSSITNTAFAGNSGAVLYIDVETDDTYAGGKVVVSDIIFVTPSARAKSFGISGEATGITGIATDNSVKGKIYDFSGRVMNAVKKGFNIINGKKVFVK